MSIVCAFPVKITTVGNFINNWTIHNQSFNQSKIICHDHDGDFTQCSDRQEGEHCTQAV